MVEELRDTWTKKQIFLFSVITEDIDLYYEVVKVLELAV